MYDSYQLTAASNWIESFAGDISYGGRVVPLQELRDNPSFYLFNGQVTAKDIVRNRQASTLQGSIKSLMQQPSQLAEWLDQFKLNAMSSLYEKTGEKYMKYIPDKALPMVNDPVSYMRSVAFHTKLGFFNPIQFFVQGSAALNVITMSPIAGMKATPATMAMARLSLTKNPAILEAMADKFGKGSFGWTKEMFLDSYRTLERTGYNVIGGGSAWRNDVGDPTIYRGKAGKIFLDKGTMFFNAGERAVRLTSWNTAYLEYVEKFPAKVGKLTEFDVAKIRDRASNLSANMTRDANSFWQNNAATSLFTQFWSYNVRLFELMASPLTGTNLLTKGEAIRLAAGQSLLWGSFPLAYAAYSMEEGDPQAALNAVNPFAEDLAAYAEKQGVGLDGTSGADILYNGMMSALFEAWTGEKLDFGSRYGMSYPQVLDTLKRTMQGDGEVTALLVTALGPSGSIVNDIIKESSKVAGSIYDLVLQEGTKGELLPTDLANSLREVSTVNLATRVGMILSGERIRAQTGSVISENEDPPMEMLKAILGVESVDQTLAFNVADSVAKDSKEIEKLKKHARRYLAPYWDAIANRDLEGEKRWGALLKAYLDSAGVPIGDQVKFLYPTPDHGLSMDKLLWKRATKDALPGVKENLKEGYNKRYAE
jgi:hypothetical protein